MSAEEILRKARSIYVEGRRDPLQAFSDAYRGLPTTMRVRREADDALIRAEAERALSLTCLSRDFLRERVVAVYDRAIEIVRDGAP